MQIINQPSLSWSHSNKLLLTQWQFPNESINALTSTSFPVMLTFLHEKSHPERLSGRGLCFMLGTTANLYARAHSHTSVLSAAGAHMGIHTEAEMTPCPAASASPPLSIIASEHKHPWNARWQLLCNMEQSILISAISITIPSCCH